MKLNKKRLAKLIQRDFEKIYNINYKKGEKDYYELKESKYIDPIELQKEINFQFYATELKLERENLKIIKNELKKYIHLPKNKKIKYNGRLRKFWSVINIILNKSKHVNNLISEYENELKIKKNRPFRVSKIDIDLNRGEFPEYFFVWERRDCEFAILHDVEIDYFNKINVRKDMDLVINYLDEVFTLMESRDIFVLVKNINTFKSYTYVISDNDRKFDELYF